MGVHEDAVRRRLAEEKHKQAAADTKLSDEREIAEQQAEAYHRELLAKIAVETDRIYRVLRGMDWSNTELEWFPLGSRTWFGLGRPRMVERAIFEITEIASLYLYVRSDGVLCARDYWERDEPAADGGARWWEGSSTEPLDELNLKDASLEAILDRLREYQP